MHKDAVNVVQHLADGSWTCLKCQKRAALQAKPPKAPAGGAPLPQVQIPCPQHADGVGGLKCSTCGGLGVVLVPADQLRVYNPASQQVLTEG